MAFAIVPDDVRAAAGRIHPLARHTPVMTCPDFDADAGVRTFFKCENLQTGGSFKIRGASNLILGLPRTALERGVVAYSSGNHAQAVAIAAWHVHARATIVMPADAPKTKIDATRRYGAEVVTYDRRTEQRETIAALILEESGGTMVPPFDHPAIMAGQGTTALELLDVTPQLDALVTPAGGGGLLSGCSVIAKDVEPSIRMFGAEPAGANDTYLSLKAGERVTVPHPVSIADGLLTPLPGAFTFPIVRELVEGVVLVTDDELRATVKYLLNRLKILVEPSGAAAAAAVLFRKLPPGLGTVGVVLSGGNVDFDQLASF